ncbi:hypothetical protein ROLI_043330 [Roseobacter fucihabitans]|uniref:Transposase IS30-like HTH domain-containing protein n=1 Tax=Roseobacter fucihabitans TaxID=1537242 RepID=A0ABZ2BYQ1_9RHOB|nr:helix-turn-helix domain-containing protein [Roseobacter litoralis]MBC6963812.1 hypothetical protein [Roseobacter litoralis]MBC6964103.1 hypothetical protein [Roseobacter litoralis]
MGATYAQLSITERRKTERWRHARVPVNEMARVLKRYRATIYHDIKRNGYTNESMPEYAGYDGDAAHQMMARRHARERKLIKCRELCKDVIGG